MKQFFLIPLVIFFTYISYPQILHARNFIHPGIYQTRADLDFMKQQVAHNTEPWKGAFDRLVAATNPDFEINPHAHVLRGSYGRPNIGGEDLRKGANLAYDCALLWYITGNEAYANKAISIINAWSSVLWDFDYNDAKLLAGWTGHLLCNAAEILRYTDSGWKNEDIDRFSQMLMTVYYPLLRFYYPQANGNWDGAIIQSVMAIAIFTDNREMFDNALNHFLYAPLNGSIFKYIWPSGQCQESTRDQAHVQLGLGEFAGAARIAYSQGIDFFSIADNRIALGYEFTASFLMGQKPFSYGPVSERARELRDDYEYVYRHYTALGVDVPFTRMAADSIRPKTNRSTLTAFRAPSGIGVKPSTLPLPAKMGYPAGARSNPSVSFPDNSIWVKPGESIQEALDKAAGTGIWVIAAAGLHTLPAPLKIPSGTVLSGEGLGTVLFLNPESGAREAMVNEVPEMTGVTIRDLVIEGATNPELASDPNSRRSYRSTAIRAGIMFMANRPGQIRDINLTNLTVRNCTWNGIFVNAAEKVVISGCDVNESGSSVVPGPRLQHNLIITRSSDVVVEHSRLVNSPHGSGIALGHCRNIRIANCEIARNGWYGLLITESSGITAEGNLIEANDRSGIMAEYLFRGSENIEINRNLLHYNNGFGIESYSTKNIQTSGNTLTGNREPDQQKISDEKYIIMQ
jgi:parallel beta-helix repeat protein